MLKCSLCNGDLNTETMATVARVVGWVEVKGDKFVGVVHHPSNPVGWAHKVCIESPALLKKQDSLF